MIAFAQLHSSGHFCLRISLSINWRLHCLHRIEFPRSRGDAGNSRAVLLITIRHVWQIAKHGIDQRSVSWKKLLSLIFSFDLWERLSQQFIREPVILLFVCCLSPLITGVWQRGVFVLSSDERGRLRSTRLFVLLSLQGKKGDESLIASVLVDSVCTVKLSLGYRPLHHRP